jgi:hypothetical protein
MDMMIAMTLASQIAVLLQGPSNNRLKTVKA